MIEERDQLAMGIGEVARLITGQRAGDEQLVTRGDKALREETQSIECVLAEPVDITERDPQLNLARDLVDVLTAGPR